MVECRLSKKWAKKQDWKGKGIQSIMDLWHTGKLAVTQGQWRATEGFQSTMLQNHTYMTGPYR